MAALTMPSPCAAQPPPAAFRNATNADLLVDLAVSSVVWIVLPFVAKVFSCAGRACTSVMGVLVQFAGQIWGCPSHSSNGSEWCDAGAGRKVRNQCHTSRLHPPIRLPPGA